MTFEQRSFKVSRPTIWNDLTAMMNDWIFQMEKSPIYWDPTHIFRCHFHQHHHLFWKQPFFHAQLDACSQLGRLPRYEVCPHISEHCPFRLQTRQTLGKMCKCWHETASFAAWMGNVQRYVDRYSKKLWYGGGIQLPLKRLPDSSISSLTRADWRQEGHPVTKNSFQHSYG